MKSLLVIIILLFPAGVLAQNPFNGSWELNLDKAKPSTQPIVFSTANGMYDCTSCVPQVHVRADGNDQPVAGLPHYTMAVKEIDSRTIEIISKRDGEVVSKQLRAASLNGETLHVRVTLYFAQSRKSTVEENTSARVGKPVPGANLSSGSWVTQKVNLSGGSLVSTYRETNSELSMSTPTGVSWTAKFDGNDYPVKGIPVQQSVALRKINDRTIEVTVKEKGTIIWIETLTLPADGRTMTIVHEGKLSGRTSTWVATKQEK
jgi:hypothetical protein